MTGDTVVAPQWAPTLLGDRVSIVTGAGSGIGRAAAQRLLSAGSRLVAVDIDAGRLAAAGFPAGTVTIEADVSDEADVERVMRRTLEEFNTLDIVVNNVGGVAGRSAGGFESATAADWDAIVGLNLKPAALLSAAAVRLVAPRSIVNVGASLSEVASPHLAAYGAAKAAVAHLTKTMAVELGRRGIRVNCVAPGFVATEATATLVSPARRASTEWAVPLGRVANPTELADVIVFLASDHASFVTGQTWVVDGGITTTTLRPPRGWPPAPQAGEDLT